MMRRLARSSGRVLTTGGGASGGAGGRKARWARWYARDLHRDGQPDAGDHPRRRATSARDRRLVARFARLSRVPPEWQVHMAEGVRASLGDNSAGVCATRGALRAFSAPLSLDSRAV